MEIKGIDLSPIRENKWERKNYKNIILLITIMILSLILSIGIIFITKPLKKMALENKNAINLTKEKIKKEELNISQLKNNQKRTNINHLQKQDFKKFIDYLTQFPANGIIEISQLYEENGAKIKINGKLTNEAIFEKIIQQIKNSNYRYKIENFQTNEKSKFEFSLTITLTGNNNEKDHSP